MAQDQEIAIVDDDPAVCESTRILLEIHDFRVRTYISATEFLKENPLVACLVVDYQMPDLNGVELVSELRKRGNQVPTIMITANNTPPIEAYAIKLGIKKILKKPLATKELLITIKAEI